MSSRPIEFGQSSLQVNIANLPAYAEDVAIQRGTLVAEVFFHIAAIRSLNGRTAPDAVNCRDMVTAGPARDQDRGATNAQAVSQRYPILFY